MAGNAKVGNRVNLWTRWQALEYITSQNFERRALEHAERRQRRSRRDWRMAHCRSARRRRLSSRHRCRRCRPHHGPAAGRLSRELRRSRARLHRSPDHRERPDAPALPLVVRHHAGGVEAQGRDEAKAERWAGSRCPTSSSSRFCCRWCRRSSTSCSSSARSSYFVNKYFHPESTNPADFQRLVTYFALFMIIDFIASTLAFALERQQPGRKRDFLLLGHVWLQRFAYRQLFSVVLFKTLKRAIEGGSFAWDKLERTATVKQPVAAGRPRHLAVATCCRTRELVHCCRHVPHKIGSPSGTALCQCLRPSARPIRPRPSWW